MEDISLKPLGNFLGSWYHIKVPLNLRVGALYLKKGPTLYLWPHTNMDMICAKEIHLYLEISQGAKRYMDLNSVGLHHWSLWSYLSTSMFLIGFPF